MSTWADKVLGAFVALFHLPLAVANAWLVGSDLASGQWRYSNWSQVLAWILFMLFGGIAGLLLWSDRTVRLGHLICLVGSLVWLAAGLTLMKIHPVWLVSGVLCVFFYCLYRTADMRMATYR